MTPAARTDAAIQLLAAISSDPATPADRVASAWFRRRRYAGAKDRRWVLSLVFSSLRRRGELDWALNVPEPTARQRTMAALARIEQLDSDGIAARFADERYGPGPLSPDEIALAEVLAAPPPDPRPPWAEANVPPDLAPLLASSLGDGWVAEMAALADPAPVDLRVNTLKGDRDAARAALKAQGIAAAPTPRAPTGLRLAGRANLAASGAYRDGLVEIQDEGAQLAALLACARPGETIIDGCAGSGGKSLALAAQMGNAGAIAAWDPRPGQTKRAAPRIRRAGVEIITYVDAVAALPDQADCVLLDVPCSGSGRWRRDPAAKWRTTPHSVAACAAAQLDILAAFAPRVKSGGRLVYVTCSLFQQENESVVESFLAAHRAFRAASAAPVWRAAIGGGFPGPDPYLRLSPRRTGTDGFFVALLRRAEDQ